MGSEALQPGDFGEPWFNDRHSPLTGKGRLRKNPMTPEQIKTDPKARWEAYVRYRDYNGGYRELFGSGHTKGAARRSLDRKIESTRQSMGSTSDLDATSTVETLARRWLGERREKGQGRHQTLVKYEHEIEAAIIPKWGGLAIGSIGTERLHRGLGEIERTRSTRQTRTVLSQIFGYAVALGALSSNPVHGLPSEVTPRERRKKKRKKTPRSLTIDETNSVIAAVELYEAPNPAGGPRSSGVLSLAVELMLATGCRIGECVALQWQDVHLDDEVPWARIAATLVEPSRKGDPPLHRQAFTKGDEEDEEEPGRDIELSPEAVDALRSHRKQTAYRRLSDPVFANRGGGWLWPANVRRMLRTAVERHAPEVTGMHPHLFRSTVATIVCEEYGIEVAQEMLGHASRQTTARYYVAKRRKVVRGQDAVSAWRNGSASAVAKPDGACRSQTDGSTL